MDFAFTQGQEMLRRSARDFLESNCPTSVIRDLESSNLPYSPQLWDRMASLGWLGLALPEQHGGEGGDIVDQLVLAEEIGMAILPSPLLASSVTCGQLILQAGSPSQRAALLPGLVRGQTIMTLALDEPQRHKGLDCLSTLASPHRSGYRISGVKTFVPYAASADLMICVAKTENPQGLTLALIEANDPGVTITPLAGIGGGPQAIVEFNNVTVSQNSILGQPAAGRGPLLKALEWTTLVRCGEMVGRAQKILEMVIDYSKSRVQFGRPIGAFQAVQHQCADLRVAVDVARMLVYRAACSLRDGLPSSEEIAMAETAAHEVSRLSTVTGHGIFAGISFTVEHDMQLYSARNRLAEANSGNALHHVDGIAEMMGL